MVKVKLCPRCGNPELFNPGALMRKCSKCGYKGPMRNWRKPK